jgi:hypothetical protein
MPLGMPAGDHRQLGQARQRGAESGTQRGQRVLNRRLVAARFEPQACLVHEGGGVAVDAAATAHVGLGAVDPRAHGDQGGRAEQRAHARHAHRGIAADKHDLARHAMAQAPAIACVTAGAASQSSSPGTCA